MTYAELTNDYASRIERLMEEIRTVANQKACPFAAGHDMMLYWSSLRTASLGYRRVSKYPGMDREIEIG